MEPVTKHCITSYNTASAWKDFTDCHHYYEEDLFPGCDRNYITDLSCLSGIKWMMEIPRILVERDYHGETKYVYDYYFQLQDDQYIYAVETNIRMCKFFSEKWHWYLYDYKSRMYKFNQYSDLSWSDILIDTYPVDGDDELYCLNLEEEDYDDSDDTRLEKCANRLLDFEDKSIDSYQYSNIYTGLQFRDDIPSGGEEIIIPLIKDFSTSSIVQQIALFITIPPTSCFSSGK